MFEKTENKWHLVLAITLIFCVIGALTFSLAEIPLRLIKIYDDMSVSEGFITVLNHGIDCLIYDASYTGKNLLLSSRNNIPHTINFTQIQSNGTLYSNLFIHIVVDYHHYIERTCIQPYLRI
ncbi:MAG: hypothetical protein LBB81_02875 [Treponema sp.]|jgi:hypothetical protein|nr:hypothetical protein [Treponema sp.]